MYEKSVMLEIKNPSKNSQKKYEKALEILEKALGYSSASGRSEISPYKSVRQLTDQSKKMVEKRLLELHNEIITRWLGLSKAAASFKLSGKIFINPSTGKPLTQAQWKTIKAEVMRVFAYVYNTQEDKIVKTAMLLGRILASIPAGQAVRATLGSLKPGTGIRILETDPQFRSALQFAQDNAAENMVDLTQRQYKRIHDAVVNAQINRLGPRQLERDLFQKFGEMNRDWRRVAETEIANQVNNGQLVTELAKPRPEGDYVYMEGISSPTACPWCASEINGTVVVLLDAPPPGGGDQLVIDDKKYTVIWPGKNNVGRPRRDWWIAAGVQHPHCILPGQEVTSGLVSSVLNGFYEGDVVEITLRSGRRLSITKNHPILTPEGFVLAQFLREGGYVISSPDPERVMKTVNPDYYQRPVVIDDLYTASLHSSSVSAISMPVASEDLHGDGRCLDGNINIVNAYGLLGSDNESVLREHRYKNGFSSVGDLSSLNMQGSKFEAASRLFRTSNGVVGRFGDFMSILWGSRSHSSKLGLRAVPWDDVSFEKSLSEGSPTHSQFSREFQLRFSSSISSNNELNEIGIAGDPTALLVSDEIIHINLRKYSGMIYDITDDIYRLYICNGVVVKNCQCSWIRYTPGYEKERDILNAAIARATEQVQKEIITYAL